MFCLHSYKIDYLTFFFRQVKIDGHDLRDLDIKWFRRQLGVVSQEPVLFVGSVAENIALGGENPDQEDIERVAKLADAHDFISEFPEVSLLSSIRVII